MSGAGKCRSKKKHLTGESSEPVAASVAGALRVDQVCWERASAAQEGPEQTVTQPGQTGMQPAPCEVPPELPITGKKLYGGAGYGSENDTSPSHLKAGHLNGSTPFRTFLAKFKNCNEYYSWDARELSFTFRRVWKETPDRFRGTQAPHLRPMIWSRCCETVFAATAKLRSTVLSWGRCAVAGGDSPQVIYQEGVYSGERPGDAERSAEACMSVGGYRTGFAERNVRRPRATQRQIRTFFSGDIGWS